MREKPKIKVTKNGPYFIAGAVPISDQIIGVDKDGESVEWKESEKYPEKDSCGLCRCGESKNKPYCDGMHAIVGFDGTETAKNVKYDDAAEKFEGPQADLWDQKELCADARFCHPEGGAWNLVNETDNTKKKEKFIDECCKCPSGRYTAVDKKSKRIEPKLPKSIGLVEDPQAKCSGPIWVRGGIPIESAEGEQYEIRNRRTLCRCGKSKIKPFCDGTHVSIHFKAKH